MSAEAKRFDRAIRAVGGTAYLLREEERIPFPASVQPRLTSGEANADPLGISAANLFTMYVPAEDGIALSSGDRVEWNESVFLVLSAEEFSLGGEVLYTRAMIRKGASV